VVKGVRSQKKVFKKSRQSEQFKRHTTKHHVYPTSRFILKKNPALHTAWHNIFQNNTPEEAMERVREWQSNHQEFKREILDNQYRLGDWKLLFAKADFSKVLSIIQSEWTFPGVRMIRTESDN